MQRVSSLWPYQRPVFLGLLANIASHPGETFTVLMPRQSGKNEISAHLVTTLLLRHARRGGSIVVCAPTLSPQATLSFLRTQSLLRGYSRRWGTPEGAEGNILRAGEATATFLSASPLANVAGHTASLLLIADEAQDIEEGWFNHQFRPMTASTGAPVVLLGTPWQGDSLLEKAVAANRRRDGARFPGSGELGRTHHEVPWQAVAAGSEAYRRHIEQERARLGAGHPIFQSQYELRSVTAEGRLLSASSLQAVAGAFPPLDAPEPGERYVAGIDFGGEGADWSVLTIGRVKGDRCEVVAVSRSHEGFDAVQSEFIAAIRDWGIERVLADGTGLGAPLVSTLSKKLGGRIERFIFTESSKSALGFELQAAAATGRMAIAPPETPGLAALWQELRDCRAEPRAGRLLGWQAPNGAHDDCVASLALCLRAAGGVRPERIARGREGRRE